jgi:hypothetical protein
MRKCGHLFHDESGIPGDDYFIVGILKVYDRTPLETAIKSAREKWHYANELHFTKTSNLRAAVYKEVFTQVATQRDSFHFSAICVKQENIDLKYFSGKKHLAYNYFTKLILQHRCHDVAAAILITDEKTRAIEDNFVEYIEWEVNRASTQLIKPIKEVIPRCSKKDDLLQLTDLLIGCVGCQLGGKAGLRKREIAKHAEKLGLINDKWIWESKK